VAVSSTLDLPNAWLMSNDMFCRKLYGETGALLLVCHVPSKTFDDFKYVVRVVTQIGGWRSPDPSLAQQVSKIYAMGTLFGSTEDDDEADPMYPEYLMVALDLT